MMNVQEFLQWEMSSRDTIDLKKIYIDIAGDLVSGILLSQLVYWNLPNKNGSSKLRIEFEGKIWLAKTREDWWDEIRVTARQFDRSIKTLEEKGLVQTFLKKFNGSPTKHIWLNLFELKRQIDNIQQYKDLSNSTVNILDENINTPNGKIEKETMGSKIDLDKKVKTNYIADCGNNREILEDNQSMGSLLRKRKNRIRQKCNLEFDKSVKTLTETTTEITTEIKTTTTNSENPVVVENLEIENLQQEVKKTAGLVIGKTELKKLISTVGEQRIKYYAQNWGKFKKASNMENETGFFVDAVRKEYTLPRTNTVLPSYANFEQRKYTSDDYDHFFANEQERARGADAS